MKKIIILLFIVIIISVSLFTYFNSSPAMMEKQIFIVNHGETVKGIARNLKHHNLITNENFFIYLSYTLGRKYINAGKYEIHRGMSSFDILKKLTKGDVLTRKITIPEGFNIYQIAERLGENEVTKADKFLYYSMDNEFLNSMKIYSSSAEGYLFPDTYIFPEASDARDIIAVMHKRMKKFLKTIDQSELKKYNFDIHKMLTFASLIEKEAKIPSERVYISSVFHNRLEKKMRLDCDPTVRYAVKKFKGKIMIWDLESNSLYNTYKIMGLPPTPICSPGKESILATLNPAKTDYLYFVARNDGSHYFSRTLREHNRAVGFYQRGLKNRFVDKQKL